jgi:hypothetical protein
MCQAAKTAAGENCPCRAMLIQSGFESGWGTGSTVPDNNYFGLHGEGNAGFRMSKPKNPKTKPVKLPINKKPEDSYKQYCHRCAVYDVTYKDDSQFVTDVTHKLTFSVYTQPSYIKNILGMMKKCDSELRACCGK